jgi:DNA mismatch repair protein MSH4
MITSQIHLHNPSLILVPDTFLSATDAPLASSTKTPTSTSLLVQYIAEEFPDVPIQPVARKYWNEQAGQDPGFTIRFCY